MKLAKNSAFIFENHHQKQSFLKNYFIIRSLKKNIYNKRALKKALSSYQL